MWLSALGNRNTAQVRGEGRLHGREQTLDLVSSLLRRKERD